jgi:MFS family permease
MVVGIKDAAKLTGISVIMGCAALICTMFLNYYFDMILIEDQLASEQEIIMYHAQEATVRVICLVAGGCLLATSVVMLFFYIKHYIDTHKKELGILKAIGYGSWKIAVHFWVFGVSVFLGAAAGFGGAFLLMPWFYALQNKDHFLPEVLLHFHPEVFALLVILPTAAFSALAICYAGIKLKQPVMLLLKENFRTREGKNRKAAGMAGKRIKEKTQKAEGTFVENLKRSTLRSKKTLVFFIVFASFCFSSMTQMSFSMKDLSSEMMGAMMLLIGLTLACVTLLLAITTVIRGNTRTIAMMQVFGYSQKECSQALLGGYRPVSYIGFALGTIYQYGLLRVMVNVVFRDVEGVPVYEFDVPVMLVSLVTFAIFYEAVMYYYTEKIRGISMKEIMLEG